MDDSIKKGHAQNFFKQLFRQTQSAENYDKFMELTDGFMADRINLESYTTGTMELIKGNETLVQFHSQIFLPKSSQPKSDSSDTSTASAGEDPAAAASRKNRKNKSKRAVVEKQGLQQKEDKTTTTNINSRVWELTDDEEKKTACLMFVQRVKDRAENHQVFQSYLNFVKDYEKHRDVDRLNNQVCELFKNQPELHIEFSGFLVSTVEAREKQKEEVHQKKREREKDIEVPVKKKQKRSIMPETAVADDETQSEEKELNHEFADVNSDRKELDGEKPASEETDASTDLVLAAPVCRLN